MAGCGPRDGALAQWICELTVVCGSRTSGRLAHGARLGLVITVSIGFFEVTGLADLLLVAIRYLAVYVSLCSREVERLVRSEPTPAGRNGSVVTTVWQERITRGEGLWKAAPVKDVRTQCHSVGRPTGR